jgi:NAD(P)-dependent dehydrogenase (short-subunit alcohol dehydrogenase family)
MTRTSPKPIPKPLCSLLAFGIAVWALRLDGKVSIVTGGNSGIGKASAILFASEGAKVVIVDVDDFSKDEILEEIRRNGGDAVFLRADMAKVEDIKRMVASAVDTYGGLDVLFNNAGTGGRGRTAEEEWNDALAVNLSSVFHASMAAIYHMAKRGGGSIISTASVAGVEIGFAEPQYDASKAGIVGLTRQLASEYGKLNIRVNCICPGLIDTPFAKDITQRSERMGAFKRDIALQRAGRAEEVANVALFLASDESSYVTGTYIIVDGGWTIHGRKYWT